MAKKKEVIEVLDVPAVKAGISKLTTEFGRTDLNDLRDKLNEVIEAVNNVSL